MAIALRRSLRYVLLILATVLAASPVAQQSVELRTLRNQPFRPFRVVGNVYYVGPAGVSSFLIVSPVGSFLIDGGMEETAVQIARNIAELGFHVSDVKYLLNSHAHSDHAGGLAELRRLSGATMVASGGDAPGLRQGNQDVPSVVVDRIIADGETLSLGDTTLTAHVTPGHTRGCTTWSTVTTENGRAYRVVFYCSTSIASPLVGNTQYPEIVADYERSFVKLRALPCDVFLGSHPEFFDMYRKLRKLGLGETNPFVDPSELRRFVESSEVEFRQELEKQKGGLSSEASE